MKDYLASDDFKNSDGQQKQEYLKKLPENVLSLHGRGSESDKELSDEDKERATKIRENTRVVMRQMMTDRAKKYLELPKENRQQYLDEMIDDMQKRREEWSKRRAERQTEDGSGDQVFEAENAKRGQERGKGFGPDRMKNRIETSSLEERALMAEFRKAMRERMAARGIQSMRGAR